jgi:hypothetical protein
MDELFLTILASMLFLLEDEGAHQSREDIGQFSDE